MMNQNLSVACYGLQKTYGVGAGRVVALCGVDLEVRQGETLMIVGPSGCGKTTLIAIVSAILNQDSGRCLVFGQDLGAMAQAQKTQFRRQTLGFVFQQYSLVPQLTAAENVAVPLLINGRKQTEALELAREALALVGLEDRWKAYPAELSGGQQQRVAIARAFVHRPKLIVCDEPTSALDHQTGQLVVRLLKELAAKEQCTLLIVTHDPRILGYADRIAHMDDGQVSQIEERADS